MIELSQQVLNNLAANLGRFSSRGVAGGSPSVNWYACAIFVSDAVVFPTSHTEIYSYINQAINGSNYYGGTGNPSPTACLGIADLIPSGSIIDGNTFCFDGPSSFTAKNTGNIGGVIFTQLYGTQAAASSTFYPLTNATTSANADLYMGKTTYHFSPFNYLLITDSVGTSGQESVTVESMSIVAGTTYSLYNSSIKFNDNYN